MFVDTEVSISLACVQQMFDRDFLEEQAKQISKTIRNMTDTQTHTQTQIQIWMHFKIMHILQIMLSAYQEFGIGSVQKI